jgi:hypothetical protein
MDVCTERMKINEIIRFDDERQVVVVWEAAEMELL